MFVVSLSNPCPPRSKYLVLKTALHATAELFYPEHELIDSEEKESVQVNACNNRLNDAAADRNRTDQNGEHSLCRMKNEITSFTIYNPNLCIL